MGQWGNPFVVKRLEEGKVITEKFLPHFPSAPSEPPVVNTEPDKTVLIERTIQNVDDILNDDPIPERYEWYHVILHGGIARRDYKYVEIKGVPRITTLRDALIAGMRDKEKRDCRGL